MLLVLYLFNTVLTNDMEISLLMKTNLLSGLSLVTRFNVQIILAMLLPIQCGFCFDDALVKLEVFVFKQFNIANTI